MSLGPLLPHSSVSQSDGQKKNKKRKTGMEKLREKNRHTFQAETSAESKTVLFFPNI